MFSIKGIQFVAAPINTVVEATPKEKTLAALNVQLEKAKLLIIPQEKRTAEQNKELAEFGPRKRWFEKQDAKIGAMLLCCKVSANGGTALMEFEKGKHFIPVVDAKGKRDDKRLPEIIEAVIEGIKNGDLDKEIDAAAASITPRKKPVRKPKDATATA